MTFSVTLTDPAGNAGPAATATAVLAATTVPAFAVTPDESSYTSADAATAGFTISPVEVGDTYTYAFIFGGGPIVPANNSGTITATSMHVTTDMSGLFSGIFTIHVIESDSVGNEAEGNAGVTLNLGFPAFTITPSRAVYSFAAGRDSRFTIAGAELASTYAYTVTSSGNSGATSVHGGGSVSRPRNSSSGIDLHHVARRHA